MIKAIAIDDEPMATKVIENFCKDIDFIQLEKSFNSSADGLKHLTKFPADLIFLDIEMPGMTGMDLFRQLKQDTMVIFITSRREYAVEGFELNAVDYLVKPFTFERFLQASKKAHELLKYSTQNQNEENQKHLFIRADFSLIKVNIADIVYVEGLDDYLKIYLLNTPRPIVARMTMKSLTERLPATNFVRIHRSFIVNISRVDKIKNKHVYVGDRELPMGASYEDEARKKLKI